jgi:hypothetical protein
MIKTRFLLLTILIYLIVAGIATAHVKLDYPVGGELFVSGETVRIKWQIVIAHNTENWDLYFSPDGGANWQEIKLNLNPSQLNYLWTVPQLMTPNARIRIDMDNVDNDYSDMSGDFALLDTLTTVASPAKNPKCFDLLQNYPNPFNPVTFIRYILSMAGNVHLTIYNQLGQEVRSLVNERQAANSYQIEWDGRDNAGKQVVSGIYMYRLQIDAFSQGRKMVLLR